MNMKTHLGDASNQDILEALQTFSEQVDRRLANLENDVVSLKSDVMKVKATMVTKDYLDNKLADHHSSLVQWTRREIQKSRS